MLTKFYQEIYLKERLVGFNFRSLYWFLLSGKLYLNLILFILSTLGKTETSLTHELLLVNSKPNSFFFAPQKLRCHITLAALPEIPRKTVQRWPLAGNGQSLTGLDTGLARMSTQKNGTSPPPRQRGVQWPLPHRALPRRPSSLSVCRHRCPVACHCLENNFPMR